MDITVFDSEIYVNNKKLFLKSTRYSNSTCDFN